MKTTIPLCLALLFLSFLAQADALSVDVSALSTSTARQVFASAGHISHHDKGVTEVGGKYAKTQGRPHVWEMGISSILNLTNTLRLDTDNRIYHSHTTYSGGLGLGYGIWSFTAGARVEHESGTDARSVFGRLAGQAKWSFRFMALSARLEGLFKGGESRTDYKTAFKFQGERFYTALRLEEVRDVKLQGVALGIKL